MHSVLVLRHAWDCCLILWQCRFLYLKSTRHLCKQACQRCALHMRRGSLMYDGSILLLAVPVIATGIPQDSSVRGHLSIQAP